MTKEQEAIRSAFLSKAVRRDTEGATVVQMERIADGLVEALKAFDEIALLNRRRHL
jgi:hypothetical protein